MLVPFMGEGVAGVFDGCRSITGVDSDIRDRALRVLDQIGHFAAECLGVDEGEGVI
jgi:hypothetical protein